MVRSELIRETSLRTGYSQNVCSEIIREMFDIITAEMEAGGFVQVTNFGVFDVYNKKPTSVRMPDTKELITVESKKYPRFLPSYTLKDKVNN